MFRITILISAVLLAGCVTTMHERATLAKTGLVGESADRVKECFGLPHREGVINQRNVWEYSTGNKTEGFSVVNSYAGTTQFFAVDVSCTAVISFDESMTVTGVDYFSDRDGWLWENANCSALIRSCY